MFSYAVPVSVKCHQNCIILTISPPIVRCLRVILSNSRMRNASIIVYLFLYFLCEDRILTVVYCISNKVDSILRIPVSYEVYTDLCVLCNHSMFTHIDVVVRNQMEVCSLHLEPPPWPIMTPQNNYG